MLLNLKRSLTLTFMKENFKISDFLLSQVAMLCYPEDKLNKINTLTLFQHAEIF